jgi:prepilin-type N-terminal cleavage/methylation domain-containing protein
MSAKFAREDGFSLAEILVTIVIISVTFTAILGGLMTSITVSSLHRKEATADALARDAAEWVKNSQGANAYQPCASTGTYTFAGLPIPRDEANVPYVVSISSVRYWDGTNPVGPLPVGFEPSGCVDHGLQDITIVAISPDGSAHETVEILKRTVT